jgi:thioredoxin-dependent peroxiredoxin
MIGEVNFCKGIGAMALTVGTIAPDFTAKDDEGKTVSLSGLQGKVVVLYFYPKDDTPGCTKQAQSFRDSYQEYQDKEMVVLGVSMDDAASHQAFKEKYGLPFQLLVDTDGAITKAYDVDGGGYAKRVTYIINSEGVISHVDAAVNTSTHAADILGVVG